MSRLHAPLRAALIALLVGFPLGGAAGETLVSKTFSYFSIGGRTAAEWRVHLRGLIDVHGDYRAAAVGPLELAALTADASAPADVRVGAAVALSVLPNDNPERARVRVAIDTAANPVLRVALERALDGEVDEALLARA